MELGCLCTEPACDKYIKAQSHSHSNRSIGPQMKTLQDGWRASAWALLRRTNIPLGNSLETQRKTVPPKSGIQGPPKGVFLGALPVCPSVTLFHFLYSTIFSFFFHSYFSFFFPALGTLSYYLIPLCNFWEKSLQTLILPGGPERLQRQYKLLSLLYLF